MYMYIYQHSYCYHGNNVSIGYNEADYIQQYLDMFGPGSLYDKAYKEKTGYPIMGPYQESTDRRFAELNAKGQTARDIEDTNQDPNCLYVMVPTAAVNAGGCGLGRG